MISKIVWMIVAGVVALNAEGLNIYEKIASFEKGVDGYIVGQPLTKEQKELLKSNALKSDTAKVAKFLANKDLLVAVNAGNNAVIAINKRYSNIDQKAMQKMMGKYILKFDEPTAMAHDKIVYWVFDKDGNKLSEDDLKNWKDSLKVKASSMTLADAVKDDTEDLKFDSYVTVKFNSDQPIMSESNGTAVPYNVNLVISSDKLMEKTVDMAPVPN